MQEDRPWTLVAECWPEVHPIFNGSPIQGSDWLDVRLPDGVIAVGKLMLDCNIPSADSPGGAYYWLVRVGVMTYRVWPEAWREQDLPLRR